MLSCRRRCCADGCCCCCCCVPQTAAAAAFVCPAAYACPWASSATVAVPPVLQVLHAQHLTASGRRQPGSPAAGHAACPDQCPGHTCGHACHRPRRPPPPAADQHCGSGGGACSAGLGFPRRGAALASSAEWQRRQQRQRGQHTQQHMPSSSSRLYGLFATGLRLLRRQCGQSDGARGVPGPDCSAGSSI